MPKKLNRYCTLCCKNSPSLDHHCTWLNTCIAESNYEPFYYLVVTSTCQTLLQAVIGILMATLWFSQVKSGISSDWHKAMFVLLWIHNAICLSLANSYFLLAGFHTYLICIRSGTYDFILENGDDGLCTRMLKCNCLRWNKKKNNKRNHVRNQDDTQKPTSTKAVDTNRGPSVELVSTTSQYQKEIAEWESKYGVDNDETASISSIKRDTSLCVDTGGQQAAGSTLASVEKVNVKRSSTFPIELLNDKASQGGSRLIHESEGIFVGGDGMHNSLSPSANFEPMPPSPRSPLARIDLSH